MEENGRVSFAVFFDSFGYEETTYLDERSERDITVEKEKTRNQGQFSRREEVSSRRVDIGLVGHHSPCSPTETDRNEEARNLPGPDYLVRDDLVREGGQDPEEVEHESVESKLNGKGSEGG